jgi:anaerobic ribonucleoside-triphosphate reductase
MSRQELLTKYQNERTRCESYSRVMGYIRNLTSFNDGKRSEWKQRVWYTEAAAFKSMGK